MSKSPGHQKWPDHKVKERRLREHVKVDLNGEVLAESTDVVRVDEDGNPPRYYFPRSDVRMEKLKPSATTSECPFKGTANYFTVEIDGKGFKDAVWTYEEPFDEHRDLKGRVAFWDDKVRDLHIAVHG